ncbi:MAG: hypothetical protein ABWY68_00295 [Cryobacterium sp.]
MSTLAACAFLDPRGSLDPQDGFASEVYLLDGTEPPEDVTATICSDLDGCEKAAESTKIRIIRFDSAESASSFAGKLGNGAHQSDRFVVEYLDSSISAEDREMIAVTVDNTASDSPD